MKYLSLAALLASLSWQAGSTESPSRPEQPEAMPLGAFSVSLAVEDLAASRRFYERLGFREIARETRRFGLVGEHEFVQMERAA